MRTHAIEVYRFEELTEDAKETARNDYREHALDYDWYDSVFEDAKEIGRLMGIEIDKIYFSGFASRGDGACFEGSYSYAKGSVKAVKSYAPEDADLHEIAKDLQAVQRRAFYKLSASVRHSGRYYHELCTNIGVDDERRYNPTPDDEAGTKDGLRAFMQWIYSRLNKEYDWLMSDEIVDENITINEYEFTEDGKIY